MIKYICLLLFCIAGMSLPGQSDSLEFKPQYKKGVKYQIVTTQDRLSGFLVDESRESVTIEDRLTRKKFEINKNTIVSMRPISDSRVFKEDLLGENAHAHTYLFAGSSLYTGQSESYVNYQWFLFQNINYGVSPYVDITVNTILLYPTSIGLKGKIPLGEKTTLGGNIFFVGNFNDRVTSSFFIGYGALGRITHGTSNTNFSFSAGVLGLNSDFWQLATKADVVNLPFGNFSYCNRFHQKWSLCAEVWYFPEAEIGFAGLGFKFLRNKQSSWTFGCFTNINSANNQFVPNLKTIPIPYLGVTSNLFTK